MISYARYFLQLITALVVMLVMQSSYAAQLQLKLPDLKGKQVSLSDYRGKWVIVNYWATWCPPCAAEIPELNAFHKKYSASKAVVLGVNIEKDDIEYVKEFVQNFKVVYPILQASDPVSSPFGHITALPTTFVINTKGEIHEKIVGGVTMQRLESVIAEQ